MKTSICRLHYFQLQSKICNLERTETSNRMERVNLQQKAPTGANSSLDIFLHRLQAYETHYLISLPLLQQVQEWPIWESHPVEWKKDKSIKIVITLSGKQSKPTIIYASTNKHTTAQTSDNIAGYPGLIKLLIWALEFSRN